MYHLLSLHPQKRFLNAEMHYLSGVTSNTDAAQLAETFAVANCPTKVFLFVVLNFVHFLLEWSLLKLYIWYRFFVFIIN